MTGPRFQFTDDAPVVHPRKGFYYRAIYGGRRLYFSENEIAEITSGHACYTLKTTKGGVYQIRSSIPDYTEFEAPDRESVPGNFFFKRS